MIHLVLESIKISKKVKSVSFVEDSKNQTSFQLFKLSKFQI